MKKEYVKPTIEITYFNKEVEMLNSSIVIDYPWGSDDNGYFEDE